MDCDHRLIAGAQACSYGYAYQSIIGTGRARFLTDPTEKAKALAALMRCQTGKEFSFTEQMTASVAVFMIEAAHFCGKSHR